MGPGDWARLQLIGSFYRQIINHLKTEGPGPGCILLWNVH